MIERRGAAVALRRLAHIRRGSNRRLVGCPGVGWPVRVARVRPERAHIVASGEAILLSAQRLALSRLGGAEGGGADVLVGAYLFATDESGVNRAAIGDAEVVAVIGDMQMRVRMPVGDALMPAVVMIHDMLMDVARPVEMLMGRGLTVITGIVLVASMVMAMSHVSD